MKKKWDPWRNVNITVTKENDKKEKVQKPQTAAPIKKE